MLEYKHMTHKNIKIVIGILCIALTASFVYMTKNTQEKEREYDSVLNEAENNTNN